MAKKAFADMTNKIEGSEVFVSWVSMYGCETWTMSKSMKERPDAAEM